MDKVIDKNEIRRFRRRRLLLWGGIAIVATVAVAGMMAGIAPTVDGRDITVGTTAALSRLQWQQQAGLFRPMKR
mgnify:CR=1 FL=1